MGPSGRAEAELAAARAFTDAAVSELWHSVQRGDPASQAQGRLAMATAHSLRAALRVVDTAFRHADRAIGRRRLAPEAP